MGAVSHEMANMDQLKSKVSKILSQKAIMSKANNSIYQLMKYWATPDQIAIPITEFTQLLIFNCPDQEFIEAAEALHNLTVDRQLGVIRIELRPEQSTIILDHTPSYVDVDKILQLLGTCEHLAKSPDSEQSWPGLLRITPTHWFNGFVWYLTFASEDLAFKVACWLQTQTFGDDEKIHVRIKPEPLVKPSSFFYDSVQHQRFGTRQQVPKSRRALPPRRRPPAQDTHQQFHNRKPNNQPKKFKHQRRQYISNTQAQTNNEERPSAPEPNFESPNCADFPSLVDSIALIKIDDTTPRKKLSAKSLTQKVELKSFDLQELKSLDRTAALNSSSDKMSTIKVF